MNGIYDEARIALHAIWTRRWVALAVAWGVCVLGWLVVSQIPNRYESRARILVSMQAILPDQTVATAQAQAQATDQLRQTLASAVNLQKVVRGTDLANTISSDRDVADRVAMLQKAIQVTAQQDNLFEVSATLAMPSLSDAQNAKLAHDVIQKLIDTFVESNLAGDRSQTSQSLAFLDQQLSDRQKQLQDADAKRQAFQQRYLGMLPGTGSMDDRIGAARQQLSQVNADLAAAQSSLNAVNGQMASTSATSAGDGGTVTAGPARARLIAIQGQLADARARGFTDQHPDVIALKAQLAQAQAAAKNEPVQTSSGGASANPVYLGLKSMQADKASQVAALTMRRDQIQSDLDRLQEKLASDPGAAAEQGQIDRSYQVLQDQYNKLLADREQVALQSSAQSQTDSVKFTVIDPPTTPRTPASPNRPLLLSAVLFAGLLGGVAAAFGLGQLRTTFPTPGRLERASGLPVIGAIGETVTAADRALRRKRLQLFAGGVAGLVVAYVALIGLEFVQRGMIA